MKKIIPIFLFLILFSLKVQASYLPSYENSNSYYGIGAVFLQGENKIYKNPSAESETVGSLSYGKLILNDVSAQKEEETFLVSLPSKNLFVLPVKSDNDEWFCVCYNQKLRLFGWIKKTENTDYMSWEDFFNVYGRKYGIYIFRNVGDKNKMLYSSSDNNSNVVDKFFFAKHVSLWLIENDWMLVKITTYDGLTKTGWFRWRLDDGTFLAFPLMNNGG